MITVELVRDLLDYDPESGLFHWKKSHRRTYVGREAGRTNKKGYRQICIGGKLYSSHRLAWLHYYGRWPNGDIDHKNRVRDDNRISNLREATVSQNGANKRKLAPLKGATLHQKGRWQAQIKKAGRCYYLGLFDTAEEAHATYCAAALEHHGEFARAE